MKNLAALERSDNVVTPRTTLSPTAQARLQNYLNRADLLPGEIRAARRLSAHCYPGLWSGREPELDFGENGVH